MKFVYQAVSASGQKIRGVSVFNSRKEAIVSLRENGLFVTDIRERKSLRDFLKVQERSILTKEIHFGAKVKTVDIAVFTRQFATLIRAGVTTAEAIRVLSQQTANKALAKALAQIHQELLQGSQLSQAAAEHKDIFPRLFINMTRSGEATGSLD